MAATPTQPVKTPAAVEVTKSIEAITGKLDALEAKLGPLSKSGVSPNAIFRRDEQGRVVSTVEEDSDFTMQIKSDPNVAPGRNSYKDKRRFSVKAARDAGYEPWGEFKSATEFIRYGLEKSGHPDFRDRMGRHFKAIAGMSESIGADGGYTVMPEFSNKIMDRVFTNDLWSRTDNYTVSGNNMTFLANAETSRATGSRHGGLRGYLVPEGGTITASKPTLREITLKLFKFAVVVYLTEELLADTGTALMQYISGKVADEFDFMLGDQLFNGTGVGQCLGIMNSPALVSVAQEGGQGPTSLVTENIVKMFARMYAGCRDKMAWFHNQDIEPELFTMTIGVGTGGQVTYMPPGGLSSSPYAQLMGRPLVPTEFNATLGTTGDIIGADMSQILSISKGSISQAVSLHVEFLSDQQAVRFILRANASPWWNAPLTPYKGTANTQGCFVTTDTRS